MFKGFFVPGKLNIFLKIIAALNILAGAGLLGSYVSTFINPNTLWHFAFLGLAYPIFIAANLLCILFWLILRKKWALLSIAIVVIGWNHHRHFYQISWGSGPLEENTKKLKILSWNVRLFDLYNWEHNEETRDSIFSVLKREDPDVICFQEFYHTDREGVFETRDTLISFLRAKYFHEGYTHKLHHEQYFGVATFSAHPIIGKGEIRFENDDNNNVIYTDIKSGEDTIRIYNAHLSSIRFQRGDYEYIGDTANSKKWLYPGQKVKNGEQHIIGRLKTAFQKRADQIAIVMKNVESCPHPVLLAGDFNDTPVSYFYRVVTNMLEDSFIQSGSGIGNTYIGKFPSFRIDYIFHSEELHSYSYKTLAEKLSDHYGISCVIEIPEVN
jgi:endonuclease/exonuclease/phosphatase family metal-dependent hydrolase